MYIQQQIHRILDWSAHIRWELECWEISVYLLNVKWILLPHPVPFLIIIVSRCCHSNVKLSSMPVGDQIINQTEDQPMLNAKQVEYLSAIEWKCEDHSTAEWRIFSRKLFPAFIEGAIGANISAAMNQMSRDGRISLKSGGGDSNPGRVAISRLYLTIQVAIFTAATNRWCRINADVAGLGVWLWARQPLSCLVSRPLNRHSTQSAAAGGAVSGEVAPLSNESAVTKLPGPLWRNARAWCHRRQHLLWAAEAFINGALYLHYYQQHLAVNSMKNMVNHAPLPENTTTGEKGTPWMEWKRSRCLSDAFVFDL